MTYSDVCFADSWRPRTFKTKASSPLKLKGGPIVLKGVRYYFEITDRKSCLSVFWTELGNVKQEKAALKQTIVTVFSAGRSAGVHRDAAGVVSLRGGQLQPLPVAEQHLRAVSGRGAAAAGRHSERKGGVFQVPGAAAEGPPGGPGGPVHLHTRYRDLPAESQRRFFLDADFKVSF